MEQLIVALRCELNDMQYNWILFICGHILSSTVAHGIHTIRGLISNPATLVDVFYQLGGKRDDRSSLLGFTQALNYNFIIPILLPCMVISQEDKPELRALKSDTFAKLYIFYSCLQARWLVYINAARKQ